MRVTYDPAVDAAFIYLREIEPGGVARTIMACTLSEGMVNLDFDKDGRLVGIEVLDATRRLPPEVIGNAEWLKEEQP